MSDFENINKGMDIYEQQKRYTELKKKYFEMSKKVLNDTQDIKLVKFGFEEMSNILAVQKRELAKIVELFEQFKTTLNNEEKNLSDCISVLDEIIDMDEEYDLYSLEEKLQNADYGL